MRKPLAMKDLFQLKPGDKFVVYWAKDDDPRSVRFNYETRTVLENNECIWDDGKCEWWNENKNIVDPNENMYDTCRGIAYFYYPEAKHA